MVPRADMMSLVLLTDESLNISYQPEPRLLYVIRRRIPPPSDKITCPLAVIYAVDQDTPHMKASFTVIVSQRLWWRGKSRSGSAAGPAGDLRSL